MTNDIRLSARRAGKTVSMGRLLASFPPSDRPVVYTTSPRIQAVIDAMVEADGHAIFTPNRHNNAKTTK